MRRFTTFIFALALGATACSGDASTSTDEPDPAAAEAAEEPETEPADPCPTDGNEREVSAECIEPWPLTVDSGTLACNAASVTIVADGTVWAVNGMASTRDDGAEIDPIWADGQDGIPKVSIGGLIDAGLDLCD